MTIKEMIEPVEMNAIGPVLVLMKGVADVEDDEVDPSAGT
jgi:hypothetical protein